MTDCPDIFRRMRGGPGLSDRVVDCVFRRLALRCFSRLFYELYNGAGANYIG